MAGLQTHRRWPRCADLKGLVSFIFAIGNVVETIILTLVSEHRPWKPLFLLWFRSSGHENHCSPFCFHIFLGSPPEEMAPKCTCCEHCSDSWSSIYHFEPFREFPQQFGEMSPALLACGSNAYGAFHNYFSFFGRSPKKNCLSGIFLSNELLSAISLFLRSPFSV